MMDYLCLEVTCILLLSVMLKTVVEMLLINRRH